MTIRILAASSPGEVRVAVTQAGRLLDYALWRPGRPDGVGDLYRGRIAAPVPAMAGSFVALPDAEGFLPDSEGGAGRSAGELVLVRITRAAQGGKGPRLTARLEAGRPDAEASGPPRLLCPGPGAVERFAALHPDAPILTDDAALLARLRPMLGATGSADRITLARPCFDEAIEEAVAQLGESSVATASGVVLHIQPTPALVAIDMDSARTTGQRLEKTQAQLGSNQAALPELAHQIRLRNLSGAILVDLAGLSVRRRAALGPAFAAALADDPLRPRFLGFTALGLAEIIRPRIHPPLHEMLAGPHAASLAALRHIAAESRDRPDRTPRLRAAPAIAAALQADTVALPDLARRTGRTLVIQADPSLSSLGWSVDYAET